MVSCPVTASPSSPRSVIILGAGAWGSALARLITNNGVSVTLWNRTFKPGVTSSLTKSLHDNGELIIAISVQHVDHVCRKILLDKINPKIIWIASKGLDGQSGDILGTLIQNHFPMAIIGVFSGPNIASEIDRGLPCGMTIACNHEETLLQGKALFPPQMIIETSPDVIGVSWWGALKNVMAIGYGLLQHNQVGHNMSATFLTLCAKEINAVVQEKGGRYETMISFAGIGDLILTSHCPLGRNRAYGQNFPQHPRGLVEGLDTLRTLIQHTLGTTGWKTPTPIIQAIADVLDESLPLSEFYKKIVFSVQ